VYDRVYRYPERQRDLRYLEEYIPKQFTGLNVLEIAAGTGYWTQFIRRQAKSIIATDVTIEALQQIGGRDLKRPVATRVLDAYSLDQLDRTFGGTFAGLWFSHVPIERRGEFLASVHRRLETGAIVVFLDNSKTQCVKLPLTYTDEMGNTYQDRITDSGDTHGVLKNFPTKDELLEATANIGIEHRYLELEHYWLLQYIAA